MLSLDASTLDPKNGLAPGDPARMAARIIERVDVEPAPLRLVLGSQALESTLATLRKRIKGFEFCLLFIERLSLLTDSHF